MIPMSTRLDFSEMFQSYEEDYNKLQGEIRSLLAEAGSKFEIDTRIRAVYQAEKKIDAAE